MVVIPTLRRIEQTPFFSRVLATGYVPPSVPLSVRPSVRLSVRMSVRPSTLVNETWFRLLL